MRLWLNHIFFNNSFFHLKKKIERLSTNIQTIIICNSFTIFLSKIVKFIQCFDRVHFWNFIFCVYLLSNSPLLFCHFEKTILPDHFVNLGVSLFSLISRVSKMSFRRILSLSCFGRFSASSNSPCVIQKCYKSTLIETATSTFQVKTLTKNEITSFKNLLPELVKDLTCNGHHKSMPQVNEHLSKVYVETNVI